MSAEKEIWEVCWKRVRIFFLGIAFMSVCSWSIYCALSLPEQISEKGIPAGFLGAIMLMASFACFCEAFKK